MRPIMQWVCTLLIATATPALSPPPPPAQSPALPQPSTDEAAIIERLQRWTAAFNSRDAAAVCDLFAPDLISRSRGTPERGRDALCAHLAAVLAKIGQPLRYAADIREIIIAGDIAMVRLVWTLTEQRDGRQHLSGEPGLDIFRRQADGR